MMTTQTPALRRPAAWLALAASLLAIVLGPAPAHAEKLRDLTEIYGARENQLVGYGLVTGLGGTGDDITVPFTSQSVLSLLRRLGVQADPRQLRLRNVAAVIVTATLPPFAKPGTKVDITVASVGNARSLMGGSLIQTILKGPDQQAYAVAQGNLVLGGFEARGTTGSTTRTGSLTAGRIPEGAIVEREIATTLVRGGALRLELRNPGFTVASRIAEAINRLEKDSAQAIDGGTVEVKLPAEYARRHVDFIAKLEDIDVTPVRRARVVINERTGTIVAGGDVRLNPSAVVHANLTIVVKESLIPSQPVAPFGRGSTVVVPKTEIEAKEQTKPVALVGPSPTLADVASALSALGLTPRELTGVLQALHAAGTLEAEVTVQ